MDSPGASTSQIAARCASAVVAGAAGLGLALQLWVLIGQHGARGGGLASALWQFLAFFTIWTNAVVAIVAGATAISGERRQWLASPAAQTASAAYIMIVLLVYEVMLRKLWQPEGAQWWADLLLHNIVPALWVAWWFCFSRKVAFAYRDSLKWLAYPWIYLAYALARGAFTGFYPYPFIDVSKHGYVGALIAALAISVVFLAIALGFIAMGRTRATRAQRNGRSNA